MPKILFARNIEIKATAKKISEILKNLNKAPNWSPWLILDPNVELKFVEDGSEFRWEGKRVGSGQMKLKKFSEIEVSYELKFLKPIKSTAVIRVKLHEQGKKTKVSWHMDTSLPFYMSWMKKSMETYLKADFDRGLLLLKDVAEKGEVVSHLEEVGVSAFKGCQYLGVTSESTVKEMSQLMSNDMKELTMWLDDEEIEIIGEPLTIYHKMDMVNDQVAFTIAYPVEEVPDEIPSPYHQGKIPKLKAYQILHEGPYRHLGNAWAMGTMMARNKEIKLKKGFPPFEVYLNDPQDTADELLETMIYFPIEN